MGRKILIVEDEEALVRLMTARLKAAGFEVSAAGDGEEGLEKVRADHPDLIILDIAMPKLDGFSVCSILKNDRQYKEIPIVILTAKAEHESEKIGLGECKADAFLAKPFDSGVLVTMIEGLLKGK